MTSQAEVVPGVYDIPAEHYHADPVPGGSLSSTGVRKLLPPGCPAQYVHDLGRTQPPKREFEIGTAAHTLVLGDGPRLAVVEADDWTTKAARDERDAARAVGAIPLLAHEHQQVQDMAAAIRQHPEASALFAPGSGDPEQTLIWQDQDTGIWCRARLDWLRHNGDIVDYKTATAADLDHIQKAVSDYGYHQQDAWYRAGVRALGINPRPEFTFVFQQKTPPYLITVVQLDDETQRIAAARNRAAIATYAYCRDTGHWPAHAEGIAYISLPTWAAKRQTEEYL